MDPVFGPVHAPAEENQLMIPQLLTESAQHVDHFEVLEVLHSTLDQN